LGCLASAPRAGGRSNLAQGAESPKIAKKKINEAQVNEMPDAKKKINEAQINELLDAKKKINEAQVNSDKSYKSQPWYTVGWD
jgi:hypothetical protein